MRAVGAALAVIALFALAGCGGTDGDVTYEGSRPPEGIRLPEFALRDYRGADVSTRDLNGRAIALTFLDTACKAACPVIARELAQTRRILEPDERQQIAFYAVTVDPRTDTPAHVRAFLRSQRAVGAVGYLLGTPAELRPVWRSFQILSAAESGDPQVHSAPVRIYDPDGEWVSTLHPGLDLTAENLAHDLRAALG